MKPALVQKSSRATKVRGGLPEDDEGLAGVGGDLRRAAGSWQARLRVGVVADHRAVEVAETVDLGGAQEADVDAAALQPVGEDLRQTARRRWRSRQARHRRSTAAARPAACRSCRTRRSARPPAHGVRRARFAAAEGTPMPTKHTQPSQSMRAAATVIISSGGVGCERSSRAPAAGEAAAERAQELRVVARAQHVALHPGA